jgi:hypothetical protein
MNPSCAKGRFCATLLTQPSLNGQVFAFLSTRRPANGGSVLSANDAKAREIKATRFDLWKLAKLADEF